MFRGGWSLLSAALVLVLPFSGGGSATLRSGSPSPGAGPSALAAASASLPEAHAPRGDAAVSSPERTWRTRLPAYPLFLRPLPGEAPLPAPRAPRGTRELVITFDDGPDLFGTPLVLAELERRGHKAVFFVNGAHLVGGKPEDLARSDLIRKIASHGHLVANHTLSHRNLCQQRDEDLEQEIDGNSEIITAATGVRPMLFRSPYGARCRRLDRALRERDLLQVGWSVDPQEWKGGSEDEIVEHVTRQLARAGGRSILLLHDTQQEAVRALPRILDWISHENDRAAREGRAPIRIRDYSVFLPPRAPLPETGFEPFLADLSDAFSGLRGPRSAN